MLLLTKDVDGFFQAVGPGEGGISSSSKSRVIDVRKRCKCEAARTLAGGGMVTRQLSYTHAERRKVRGKAGRRKGGESVSRESVPMAEGVEMRVGGMLPEEQGVKWRGLYRHWAR